MEIIFTDADEAHIEANHISAADPEAYDAWCEELHEQETQHRARARVNQAPRKMRSYR